MKLRRDKIDVTEAQERALEAAVRSLAQMKQSETSAEPSTTYFANLIAKTNEKIDYVTSGKALSISWLARVAVPGVVAILFFFIGLHYYKPEMNGKNSVTETVKSLPETAVDSMIVASFVEDGSMAVPGWHADAFSVSNAQLAEYFVSSGSTALLLEAIPEQQLDEVASILETKATNL